MRKTVFFMTLFIVLVSSVVVFASEPYIPAEFLNRRRRLQGNEITFCVYEDSATYAFDRAVAEEAAHMLLLEPRVFDVQPPPFRTGDSDVLEEMFVLLSDHCDAIVGLALLADTYPDWIVFSRPYYYTPYVLVVADPEYDRLLDIPRDKAIGSQMLTHADWEFISFLSSLPKEQRWQRIPYLNDTVMVERLLDGTLAAALMWAPAYQREVAALPDGHEVRVVPASPLRNMERPVGMAMLSADTFLRVMLDDAIVAMVEDGIMDELLAATETMGRPAR